MSHFKHKMYCLTFTRQEDRSALIFVHCLTVQYRERERVLLVTAKIRVAHEVDGEVIVTGIFGCGELKLRLCRGRGNG